MKHYVTYRILEDAEYTDADSIFYVTTGNKSKSEWGFDTPIYLNDHLLAFGYYEEAIRMLRYCLPDDTKVIQNLIATDLIKAYMNPWIETVGNSDLLDELLVLTQGYLDANYTSEELQSRFDYCGDIIPGVAGASENEIIAKLTEIRLLYESWFDRTAEVVVFREQPSIAYRWFRVGTTPIVTNTPGFMVQYMFGPENLVQDPFNYTIPNDAYVAPVVIGDQDDNYYFNQSEALKADALSQTPIYYRQRAQVHCPGKGIYYHITLAAWLVAKAAMNAVYLAVNSVNLVPKYLLDSNLENLIFYLKLSRDYECNERNVELQGAQSRINELEQLSCAVAAAPVGTYQNTREQALIDAVNTLRFNLLHDKTYIQSFDVDVSNRLSIAEIRAMEADILKQCRALMLNTHFSYSAELQAIDARRSEFSSMLTIIQQYLE